MANRFERRQARLNAYVMDANGEYHYTGDWYRRKAAKPDGPLLLAGNIALIAAVIGSGCIDAAGMRNTFYVILPYIIEASLLFALEWQAVRILSGGRRLKAYVYESAVPKLPRLAMALACAALLGLVCAGLFLALNGTEGRPAACAAYLALKLTVAALALLLRRVFHRVTWEKD